MKDQVPKDENDSDEPNQLMPNGEKAKTQVQNEPSNLMIDS
jgi:hypothetical protein